MFVEAIEKASRFTRPVHGIHRYFGSTEVHPSTATLFFVNDEGWALTCRHVAQQIHAGGEFGKRFETFKAERDSITGKHQKQREKELAKKHGFGADTVVELKSCFVNCIEGSLNVKVFTDTDFDVALLQFQGYENLLVTDFPTFAAAGDSLRQGRFLCRLGFPFPEFTNYAYDEATDSIAWTSEGREDTPRFPIEGMVTRHILGNTSVTAGFELSTPGLRGQSGGPAFDAEGRVWGMQCATAHLDLDFDVDLKVNRQGKSKHVRESAILHVGHCLHVNVLKDFMRRHSVRFNES